MLKLVIIQFSAVSILVARIKEVNRFLPCTSDSSPSNMIGSTFKGLCGTSWLVIRPTKVPRNPGPLAGTNRAPKSVWQRPRRWNQWFMGCHTTHKAGPRRRRRVRTAKAEEGKEDVTEEEATIQWGIGQLIPYLSLPNCLLELGGTQKGKSSDNFCAGQVSGCRHATHQRRGYKLEEGRGTTVAAAEP